MFISEITISTLTTTTYIYLYVLLNGFFIFVNVEKKELMSLKYVGWNKEKADGIY